MARSNAQVPSQTLPLGGALLALLWVSSGGLLLADEAHLRCTREVRQPRRCPDGSTVNFDQHRCRYPACPPDVQVTKSLLRFDQPGRREGAPAQSNPGRERLTYWTEVATDQPATLTHLWLLNGKEVQRRRFRVRPPLARFHTARTVKKGAWSVQVLPPESRPPPEALRDAVSASPPPAKEDLTLFPPFGKTALASVHLLIPEDPCAGLARELDKKIEETKFEELRGTVEKLEDQLRSLHMAREQAEGEYRQCIRDARDGGRGPEECQDIRDNVQELAAEEEKLHEELKELQEDYENAKREIDGLRKRHKDCAQAQRGD